MTGAAAAATAYWFGRGLQPAMPGVQSVQPDAGSLFRRTIHNATRLPVKRHRGSRDTHGTHKRTRGHTDHRDEPHKQPNPATTHPHDQTRQPKPETGKPRPTQQQQEQPQARSRPLPAADSEEAAPSEPDHLPPPATGMRVCAKHGAMCSFVHGASGTPTGTYR